MSNNAESLRLFVILLLELSNALEIIDNLIQLHFSTEFGFGFGFLQLKMFSESAEFPHQPGRIQTKYPGTVSWLPD